LSNHRLTSHHLHSFSTPQFNSFNAIMNTSLLSFVTALRFRHLALVVALLPCLASARPVDLSVPEGGFGPSNFDGTAQTWLEMEDFELGEGLALPFRLRFSSLIIGPDFGPGGWTSPLFGSRAGVRSSGVLHVILPCGKEMILRPSQAEAEKGQFSDGEWIGQQINDQIEVGREDGWKMEFNRAGYLTRLTTDDKRIVEWLRAPGSHFLQKVVERAADGTVIQGLSVRRDPRSQRVLTVDLQGVGGIKRAFNFHYDKQGRLWRVARPEKVLDEIEWKAGPDELPGMELRRADGSRIHLAWGEKDRLLRWDGLWKYEPDTSLPGFPRITRTGPYGEREVYHDTRKEDGKLVFESANGISTTKHHLVGGPAHRKLEKITRKAVGGDSEQMTYRAVYDQRGLLVGEFDALERKTTHSYELFGATAQSGIKKHLTTSPLGGVTTQEFDRHGSLLARTDALGHTTRYEYDSRRRRTRTVGPDRRTIERLSYTKEGRLASRTDALGATTGYEYDRQGNRIATIDALGKVTRDEFDGQRRRIRSTDPLGRVWSFQYDAGGRLTAQTAPDGTVTQRTTYDENGRRLTVTDAAGNVTTYTHDLHGRQTSVRDALERLTQMEYDIAKGATGCTTCSATASATTVISPSGSRTVRRFDADQRLLEEAIYAPGTDAPLQTTQFEYDAVGNLIAVTDPLGRVTRHEYDLEDRRIRTVHPDQTTRSYAYNAAGQLIQETDETGAITKREYDPHGNLIAITDAEGNTTRTLFETAEDSPISMAAARRPTGIELPGGRRNHIEYDLLGRRVALTQGYGTPDAATTRSEFDAVGNEISSISPTGQITRHRYDERNRRVKTTDALNRVWQFEYTATAGASGPAPCCGASPAGNAQAATTLHPDGSKETRVTDAGGQLISTTDAKGHTIEYRYTPDGRMAELIDGKGSVTQWSYDARGKLLAKTYPDGGTERYEHDAAGQLIRRIRPDGTAATHSYDSRGRLLSVKWDADRSEPITYTYDAAGRMTSASNTSATVARSYTATGRLATETQTIRLPDLTQPVENRLTYEYSPDGRLAAITYPDASKVQHYHNARGELIEIIDTQPVAGLDANNARYTYTRRPDGKITALTHPNGVTTTRDYDEVGRLAKIAHLDPTGKVLESEASTYDQRDRRLTRTRADGSTDLFRYDPAGQVTAAAYAQASDPQNPNPVNPSENPVNPVEKSDEAEQKDFTPNQTFVYDEAGNCPSLRSRPAKWLRVW
jgi:YD repeat-containing protein